MSKQVAWMARPLGLMALLVGAAIVMAQDRPPATADQGIRPGQQAQPGQRQQLQPGQEAQPRQPAQPAGQQPRVARRPATGGQQAGRLPQAVLDTHQLMSLFNAQVYELLREEMSDLGQLDEKKRETLGERGLQVAEVANLVALPREGAEHPRWQQLTAELQQAGIKLSETAKEGDAQAVQTAYRAVIQQCNACHQTVGPQRAPQLDP